MAKRSEESQLSDEVLFLFPFSLLPSLLSNMYGTPTSLPVLAASLFFSGELVYSIVGSKMFIFFFGR
jgi:hypothetical protein